MEVNNIRNSHASCSVSSRMVWKPLTIWNLPLKNWPQICTRWEIQFSLLLPLTQTFPSCMHHALRVSPLFSLSWFLLPVQQIKQVQDEERKQLTQLRDVLKSALQVEQKEVTHTHLAHTHPPEWADLRAVFSELFNMLPVSSEDCCLLFPSLPPSFVKQV